MSVRRLKKKTKLFALPIFGSLRGSTSASLKTGKIWQVFETGGRTYFTPLIHQFFNYAIKIGSSAPRAVNELLCLLKSPEYR